MSPCPYSENFCDGIKDGRVFKKMKVKTKNSVKQAVEQNDPAELEMEGYSNITVYGNACDFLPGR